MDVNASRSSCSALELPADFLSSEERFDRGVAGPDLRRNAPGTVHQRHALLVWSEAVEAGAVEGREGFEAVEGALLGEDSRIELERRGRGEDAGAAAIGFLVLDRMGRRVGAKEELGIARGRRAAECQPVQL